jgi:hypothetical protein
MFQLILPHLRKQLNLLTLFLGWGMLDVIYAKPGGKFLRSRHQHTLLRAACKGA